MTPQLVGPGGEHQLLLPDDYSFNPLCNLIGHDWIKEYLWIYEKTFMHKYCLRCWKVSYEEDS